MTDTSKVESIAKKHILTMIVLTLAVPAGWLGYYLYLGKFSVIGLLRNILYYGFMIAVLSNMKKGNGDHRKVIGVLNLIGALAAVSLIIIGNNDYPTFGIAAMGLVWAYTAWGCLFSKSVKTFLMIESEKSG